MAALYKLIKKVPEKEYTECFIKFAEAHAGQAMRRKAVSRFGTSVKDETFNLNLFWNTIFSPEVPERLRTLSMESLSRLVSKDSGLREDYISNAGTNIVSGTMFESSLEVLRKLGFTTALISGYGHPPERKFDDFMRTHCVIALAVKACAAFHGAIRRNFVPEMAKTIMGQALDGMSVGAQARLYLDFLHEACTVCDSVGLSQSDIETIWGCYVGEPFCEEHSGVFWETLMKEKKETRKYGFFNSTKALVDFFDSYLANSTRFAARKMTAQGLQCFRKYFEIVNGVTSDSKSVSRRPDRLKGVDMVWKLAIECDSSAIRTQSASWLIDMNFRYMLSIGAEKKLVVLHFMQTAFLWTHSFPKPALSLLQAFILRVEETACEPAMDPQNFSAPPFYNVTLALPGSTSDTQVFISQKLQTSHLLSYISNMLQVPKSRITLRGYNGSDVTEDMLFRVSYYPRVTVDVRPELLPSEYKPRSLLVNSAGLFDDLLGMLMSGNGEVADEVWRLLEELPKSRFYLERLGQLKLLGSQGSKDWEEYLQVKAGGNEAGKIAYSMYTLAYLMDNIAGGDKAGFTEYMNEFYQAKGFDFILKVLATNIDSPKSKVQWKSLNYALEVMNVILEHGTIGGLFPTAKSKAEVWDSVDKLIETIYNSGENLLGAKDVCEILGNCSRFQILVATLEPAPFSSRLMSEEYLARFASGLFSPSPELREKTWHCMRDIYDSVVIRDKEKEKQERRFAELAFRLFFDRAIKSTETSYDYFCFLHDLVERFSPDTNKYIADKGYVRLAEERIVGKLGTKGEGDDFSLCGLLEILAALLPRTDLPLPDDSLYERLISALFGTFSNMTQTLDLTPVTCRTDLVRSKALLLLKVLINRGGKHSPKELFKQLLPLHLYGKWRSRRAGDWKMLPDAYTQARTEYVGLANMGATCYMNATLQQLYMIPELRYPLLALDYRASKRNELIELQQIFGAMQEKRYASYRPKGLCEAMKINAYYQRDASEFLINLLDKLKEELKETEQKDLIENLFESRTSTEVICSGCKSRSERVSTSLMLDLEVKNKKNIVESLAALVHSELLQGENAYQCDKCEKKVTAERRETLKTLPNVLLLNLKRFELSYEGNNRKLNSYWEFPLELDLEEYTQYALLKRDIESEAAAPETPIFELPKGYYRYKLRGVVVHIGSIDSGHYYSFIEDRESAADHRWFEFNDTMVREFPVDTLPEEAFGHKEGTKLDIRESTAAVLSTIPEEALTRSNNAYMLVYEREIFFPPALLRKIHSDSCDPEDPALISELHSLGPRVPSKPTTMSQIVTARLGEERNTFLLRQFLFHADYARLVADLLVNSCEIPQEPWYVKNLSGTDAQMFAFAYFFTTALRSDLSPAICQVAGYVKKTCKLHKGICIALASMFSLPTVIKEFVIECPRAESRKLVAGLLKTVMEMLYPDEKDTILGFVRSGAFLSPRSMEELATSKKRSPRKDRTVSMDTASSSSVAGIPISGYRQTVESLDHSIPYLLLLIDAFVQQSGCVGKGCCGEYFQVLTCFAQLGKEAKLYLVGCGMFGVGIEALDLTKKTDCRGYAGTVMPHFVWKGSSMIGEIARSGEETGTENEQGTTIVSQAPYIFQLLVELLTISTAESDPVRAFLRKSGVKEIAKAYEAENEYTLMLMEDRQLKSLLGYAGQSKVGLTAFARLLRVLCETKREVFSVPVISFMAKNLSTCAWNELRLYMRPLLGIMKTLDLRLCTDAGKPPLKFVCDELSKASAFQTYTVMVACIDFVIKVCKTVPGFREYLVTPAGKDIVQEAFEESLNWTRRNKQAATQMNLFKSIRPGLAIKDTDEFAKVSRQAIELRESELVHLKDPQKTTSADPDADSDDDMYSARKTWEPGKDFDVYLYYPIRYCRSGKKRWTRARVTACTEEIACLEYKAEETTKAEQLWLSIESDLVAPAGSKVGDIRARELELLKGLKDSLTNY